MAFIHKVTMKSTRVGSTKTVVKLPFINRFFSVSEVKTFAQSAGLCHLNPRHSMQYLDAIYYSSVSQGHSERHRELQSKTEDDNGK